MPVPLRVLIAEADEGAVTELLAELRRGGWEPEHGWVRGAAELAAALARGEWQIFLASIPLPGFEVEEALGVVAESGMDVPLLLVAEAKDEERALDGMRAGARDYVLKERPERLRWVVERELRDAGERR